MSTKRGIWAVALPLSIMRNWCKRTADRYRWVAGRIADQSRLFERENQLEAARATNAKHPSHADFAGTFAGEFMELSEFTEVLTIGDRIRVLCDDGILVAEKISPTEFKFIHAEMMTESIH